jgi:uroporphyrinogen-III synthase
VNARLAGLGVVITRPASAAEPLAAALEREGARVWRFPALAIEAIEPSAALAALLARLADFDLAVFVSAHAVERGVAVARRFAPWPAKLETAAVGEATAQALRAAGIDPVIAPRDRHDSEALLDLARLRAVQGQNIIVFRGEGGREQIRETLEARGAKVEYAECYRRVRPEAHAQPLAAALARGEIHAVSVLSGETLENFVAMIGRDAAASLATVTLVVPHPAVGEHREAKRFARVVLASHGAAGLADALAQLRVTT